MTSSQPRDSFRCNPLAELLVFPHQDPVTDPGPDTADSPAILN